MRQPGMVNILVACVFLASCVPGKQKSVWDGYDYQRIARGQDSSFKDYDDYYSLPVTSCIDDAPSCE